MTFPERPVPEHPARRLSLVVPALFGAACLLAPGAALAEDAIDTGDTAWMLTSSLLVLMMTLPGLALFYGGLVRVKNILSVLMQCLISAGLMGVLWVIAGYNLVYALLAAPAGSLSDRIGRNRFRCLH